MSKVKFGWLKDYAGTKFLPKTLAKLIYNDDGTTILDTFTKVEQETDKKFEDLTSNVNSQFQSVNESIDGINDSINNINEAIEDINEFNDNINDTIDGKITNHNADEDAHGLKDKFSDFESADKTNAESIASHIDNKNNPHEVTADQIDAIHKSVINAPGGVVGLDNDGNIEVNNITTQGEAFYFTDNDGETVVIIDNNGLKTAYTTIRNTLTIGNTSLTEEEAKKLKNNTYTKDEVYNKEQVYNKEEVNDIKQVCMTEIDTKIAGHNIDENAHSNIINAINTELENKANSSDVYTKAEVDELIPEIPNFPSVDDINELIETHNKETNAHSEIVSTINTELGKKLGTSEVVAEATPNKVLKLNDDGKLPASITGDADTVDGKHADDFVLKEVFEEHEENNNNAHTAINDSIQSLNSEIETLKEEGLKGAALEELRAELKKELTDAIETHNADESNVAHQNIRSDIQDLSGTLSSHINNKENPHGVTAEQIEAVSITRTVNGHALNEDITLTYADVGAEPSGAINIHNNDPEAHGINEINGSIKTLTETKADSNDVYKKDETYSQNEIDNLISAIPGETKELISAHNEDKNAHGIDNTVQTINTSIENINKDIEDINQDIENINTNISTKLEESAFNDFKGDFESVEAAITGHDTNENAHSDIVNAINDTLGTKADSNNVYNKTEITDLLADKADKNNTYNKENEEVENLIASHESDDTAHGINSIVANLNNKANLSDVYDKDTADNTFALKSHASTDIIYGLGNKDNYGHVKLSDATDSDNSAVNGIAATPKAIKKAIEDHNNATDNVHSGIVANLHTYIDEKIGELSSSGEANAGTVAAALETHKANPAAHGIDKIQKSVEENSDSISTINETLKGKANVGDVYNKTEIDGLLGNKADKDTTYNKTEVDNLIGSHNNESTAHGINDIVQTINDSLGGKADKNHASSETIYGLGSADNYGHVKLSDAIDNESDNNQGIAATPKAIYTVNNALTLHKNNKDDAHGINGIKGDIININNSISTINEELENKANSNDVDNAIENLIPKSDINEPNGVVGLDGNGNIEINNITVSGEEKAFYFIDNEKDAIAIIDEYGLRTTRVAATTALTIGDTQLSSEDAKKLKDDVYTKDEVEELIENKLEDLTSSGEATPETILALVQSLQKDIGDLTAALAEQAGKIPTIKLINHMIPDNPQE